MNKIKGFTQQQFFIHSNFVKDNVVAKIRHRNNSQQVKTGAGFTLIEVIIYLALLSVIMGTITVVFYGILEASGRDFERTELQTEGDFILAKIAWALRDASNLTVTPSPAKITLNKYSYNSNPIIFYTNGGKIMIQEGNKSGESLNNDDVNISGFVLQDLPPSGQDPEGVFINFTLSSSLSGGRLVSQDFQETEYLAK